MSRYDDDQEWRKDCVPDGGPQPSDDTPVDAPEEREGEEEPDTGLLTNVITTLAAPKFPIGHLVATPAALEKLLSLGLTGTAYVARHLKGDWGDLDDEDRQVNERALKTGERLLSSYTLPDGGKLWVVTEWDRSVTTLLLPEDY